MHKPYMKPIIEEADLDLQDQGCLDAPVSVAPGSTPRSEVPTKGDKDK